MELNNKILGLSLKPQGWGVFQISSDRDDTEKDYLGLKFSMSGGFFGHG